MKDRLLTLGLALAALAAFYALLVPKPAPPSEQPTRPISIEQGPNGYLALTRWLNAQGVATVSLRERYTGLEDVTQGLPRAGHLLITTLPHTYPIRPSEADALRDWVQAGNTLLVIAGLSDTPDWSTGEGADAKLMDHLLTMTGVKFVSARATEQSQEQDPSVEAGGSAATDESKQRRSLSVREALAATSKLATPLTSRIMPIGEHPLLAGVGHIEASSEYPSAQWRARSDVIDLLLTLAEDSASREPALWLGLYGQGQIVLSAYGSILTNKQLGKAGNARFLANVVSRSLGPNARVIIDDAHQGLVAFYDPDAFFGDRRLHATLWWLLALWFVFVLGSQRLRASTSVWQPVDITSFVRATGGFLARVLRPATAAQRLYTNFFDDVSRHTGLSSDAAAVWEWLGSRSVLAPRELAQLRELHASAVEGRRVDPLRVQTLLAQARERLK